MAGAVSGLLRAAPTVGSLSHHKRHVAGLPSNKLLPHRKARKVCAVERELERMPHALVGSANVVRTSHRAKGETKQSHNVVSMADIPELVRRHRSLA